MAVDSIGYANVWCHLCQQPTLHRVVKSKKRKIVNAYCTRIVKRFDLTPDGHDRGHKVGQPCGYRLRDDTRLAVATARAQRDRRDDELFQVGILNQRE